MSVECVCSNPSCRKRYAVTAAAVGKSVTCKACGETFIASASKTQPDDYLEPAWGDTAKPATTTTATAPATIGRFAIRGKLGAGAFGTVYRAYDPQLDRVVALKVPNPGVMTDAKRAERFLREAKAAANLHHPHIVPVFDAGKDGDTLYIASAFIGGQPLADSIPETGAEFARAARLVRELAEALAYAHEQGIVHRDVKPANVMLDTLDRVHLMDFGLAARQEEAGRLTNDGAVMGTPAYMSPEQARGQKGDAQPATDQYAAGVVLYELLTGRTPFGGPVAAIIAAVLTTEPDPPRKVRPDVPRDLETICLKALSKKPEDRYPDCQALADDLRRWAEGEPVTARPLGLAERAVRWLRKEPKLAGAVAAVALVLLISVLIVSDAARKAEAALLHANQSAADREAAEEREKRAAGGELGALGTAAEERRKAEGLLKDMTAERERAAVAVAEVGKQTKRAELAEAQVTVERKKAETEAANAGAAHLASGAARKETDRLQTAIDQERKRVEALQAQIDQMPGQLPRIAGHNKCAYSAAFSPDGNRIVTASEDETVRVWDVRTGAEQFAITLPTGKNYWAAFSPNGAKIWTSSIEHGVRAWDAKAGGAGSLLHHTEGSLVTALNSDGTRVIKSDGGKNDTTQVWGGGKILALTKRTSAAAFSGDGKRIVTGDATGVVRVWEASRGDGLFSCAGHAGFSIRSVAFSPDGARVMAASENGGVKIWDARDGAKQQEFGMAAEGKEGVNCAAFSPDGARIVTGSRNGTVRVWSAKTGAELLTLSGHTDTVTSVAFCPDGLRVVAACRDGAVRLWWVTAPVIPAKK